MGRKVLLIISNPNQAAYRLRWGQLLPGLEAAGIQMDVQVRPKGFWGRRRLACGAAGYEAVVLQRKLLDPWEARLLRRKAKRIYFDVDDAVMFRPKQVSRFSQWRQGRRFRATAKILDVVVAGNEYLAGQFAAEGCTCQLLPTTVDPGHYQVRQHAAGSVVRLVWIGARSTLPYVQQFLPYLEQAQREMGNLELITIADATVQSSILPVRHIPWSVEGEASALVQGDIGIAPTPEDPWAMGKCGFKIIQYMASGLPVVASPVGMNAKIVREEESGLLPRQGGDWPGAIARLAGDVALRQRMGAAGRQTVLEEYPCGRAVTFWGNLLSQ
jgi:hypothetical protein